MEPHPDTEPGQEFHKCKVLSSRHRSSLGCLSSQQPWPLRQEFLLICLQLWLNARGSRHWFWSQHRWAVVCHHLWKKFSRLIQVARYVSRNSCQLTKVTFYKRRWRHVLECHDLHTGILVLKLRQRPEDEIFRSNVLITMDVVIYAKYLDLIFQHQSSSFKEP